MARGSAIHEDPIIIHIGLVGSTVARTGINQGHHIARVRRGMVRHVHDGQDLGDKAQRRHILSRQPVQAWAIHLVVVPYSQQLNKQAGYRRAHSLPYLPTNLEGSSGVIIARHAWCKAEPMAFCMHIGGNGYR